ncbi:hypothetical protein U3516DRAFT_675727 [Neocallimastix sp. 'constans']
MDYIDEYYLKKIFVEARLAKYPDEFQILNKNFTIENSNYYLNSVELKFEEFTNPIKYNNKNEETIFKILMKNINTLYVKEYEINTLAVCKEKDEDLDSFYLNFDVSGLLPIKESTYTYNKSPLERWVEEFKFKYNKRCVCIIEFIGKNLACRAIVRNGDLRYIERKEIYGQVIHIIDENNNFVTGNNYSVWFGNNMIKANEDGEFIIPYGNKRNESHIILSDGEFAKKYNFTHEKEEYSSDINFILNNESITMGNKATLIVRIAPKLLYNVPIPCELIENAELNISIKSIDNISVDKTFTDVKFKSETDATFEFTVPENVASITASLKGSIKISSQSGNKKYEIDESKTFNFNEIDSHDEFIDIQLKKNNSGYYLIVLGKNGEVISNYVVLLKMEHIFVKKIMDTTLQTDENGIIELGKLPYIRKLTCNINNNYKSWDIISKHCNTPNQIVISEGDVINIAYPYDIKELQNYPNLWGLFKILPSNYKAIVEDLSDKIKFDTSNSIISIENLKAGCYSMQLDYPYENGDINIIVGFKDKVQHVTKLVEGLDDNLYYKLDNKDETFPLQIIPAIDNDNLNIELLSNDQSTLRVHVILSNFIPLQNYYNKFYMSTSYPIMSSSFLDVEYLYNNHIEIPNEKLYIQSRKLNKNLLGNMLRKPTSILVPFENKKAVEEKEDAYNDGLIGNASGMNRVLKKNVMNPGYYGYDAGYSNHGNSLFNSFNYNFLSHPGKCLCNLIPDETGKVSIPLSLIDEDYSYVEIIAVNSYGSISKVIDNCKSLTTMSQSTIDVSMASKLKSNKFYIEKRETTTVAADNSLEIIASSGTRITTVESIAKVLFLATIINPKISNDVNEFTPIITKWESFNFKDKCQKYSSHICNELNFYLYFKDREFFNQVIKPFIKSKLIKSFIDKWLLKEDLIEYVEDSVKFNALNDFEIILLYYAFKENNVIAEKLKNHLKNKIDRMEKNNKLNVSEMKKIFDTIIENGEEIKRDDDDDEDEDKLEMEEEEEKEEERPMLNQMSTTTMNKISNESYNSFNTFGDEVAMDMDDEPIKRGGPRLYRSFRAAPMQAARAMPSLPPMSPSVGGMRGMTSSLMALPRAAKRMNNDSINKLLDVSTKVKTQGPMFYEEIEKTTVWSETGNWKSSINETINIEMNMFWKDVFESSDPEGRILSKNFINIINKSFSELIFACALMDLPLIGKDNQEVTINPQIYRIKTKSNIIVLYKQLMESEYQKNDSIFCLRSYFDREKSLLMKNDDESSSKVNPSDFEPGRVYGCEIIITNVSLSTKFLDILYQIPNGAISVCSGKKTTIEQIKLNKYSSKNIKFYFYFPKIGEYIHTPVYISHKETYVVAVSPETKINVSTNRNEDKVFESWIDIANYGKSEDVLKWLKTNSSSTKQLDQIYWRLKDKSFFDSVIKLFNSNYEYDEILWSYGFYHNNVKIALEYLLNNKKYLNNHEFIYLECNKIIIDKIESKEFTLLDYYPLINKRVHKLPEENGSKMIMNKEFSDYYDDLLIYLINKPLNSYTSRDYLQFICCLLLQDRVAEAITIFKIFEKRFINKDVIKSDSLNGLIQRDYIASYLDFYNEKYIDEHQDKKLKIARERSLKYDNYPIKNWNNMFSEIIQSIKYLDDNGEAVNINDLEDKENTTLKVNNLIENTPLLEMKIDNQTLHIKYRNITQCKICYYPVDFEMQFSVQPFILSENSKNENDEKKSNVSYTMPKDVELITLPEDKQSIDVPINKNYIQQHSIIEIQGCHDYFIKSKCIYQPSKLSTQINENLGILRVFKPNPDIKNKEKPFVIAPGVYVKVYSKNKRGKVSFWKDGYTDLLGRFDYITVSSNSDILDIEKLSILILFNDTMGEIKEVKPPKI